MYLRIIIRTYVYSEFDIVKTKLLYIVMNQNDFGINFLMNIFLFKIYFNDL